MISYKFSKQYDLRDFRGSFSKEFFQKLVEDSFQDAGVVSEIHFVIDERFEGLYKLATIMGPGPDAAEYDPHGRYILRGVAHTVEWFGAKMTLAPVIPCLTSPKDLESRDIVTVYFK